MAPRVLIPWRATDCPHRTRALEYITARYEAAGHTVALGRHDDGAWCKALAVADALAQTNAEVVVVADADVWCDGLPEAVEHVQAGAPWAIPHRAVHRLTEAETARVLAGAEPNLAAVEQHPYRGVAGGGLVVLRRDVYETCPMDPRFRGWGQEDESLGWALTGLHGPPWRGTARLVHLWHPHPPRATRKVGTEAGQALARRYFRARNRPDVLRALIDEGRQDADRPAEPSDHARAA